MATSRHRPEATLAASSLQPTTDTAPRTLTPRQVAFTAMIGTAIELFFILFRAVRPGGRSGAKAMRTWLALAEFASRRGGLRSEMMLDLLGVTEDRRDAGPRRDRRSC